MLLTRWSFDLEHARKQRKLCEVQAAEIIIILGIFCLFLTPSCLISTTTHKYSVRGAFCIAPVTGVIRTLQYSFHQLRAKAIHFTANRPRKSPTHSFFYFDGRNIGILSSSCCQVLCCNKVYHPTSRDNLDRSCLILVICGRVKAEQIYHRRWSNWIRLICLVYMPFLGKL